MAVNTAKAHNSSPWTGPVILALIVGCLGPVISIWGIWIQRRTRRRGEPAPVVTQWKEVISGPHGNVRIFHIVLHNYGRGEATVVDVGIQEYKGSRSISIRRLREQGLEVGRPALTYRLEGLGWDEWTLRLTDYQDWNDVAQVQAFAQITGQRRRWRRSDLALGRPEAINASRPEWHNSNMAM